MARRSTMCSSTSQTAHADACMPRGTRKMLYRTQLRALHLTKSHTQDLAEALAHAQSSGIPSCPPGAVVQHNNCVPHVLQRSATTIMHENTCLMVVLSNLTESLCVPRLRPGGIQQTHNTAAPVHTKKPPLRIDRHTSAREPHRDSCLWD